MTIEALHPDFGARVTGIDLAAPLDDGALSAVRRAIDDYSFLCFPDQALDDDGLLAFTRQIGEPEVEHVRFGRDGVVQYLSTIGNIDDDGSQRGNDHEMTKYFSGNNMWHSDSSFREVPTLVTITHAHEVPDQGGETEFVSARAAYGNLPEARRHEIDPLTVIHDYVYSRSQVAPVKQSHADSLPPIEQKLVRTNPATGARNYYVGSHAKTVVGWNEGDSRALLDDLLARATGPEQIYAHRWRRGDLVIWDNRCLLHRGRPYDADRYRRRMRQTRVCGAGSTLRE
ncbi:MAG: TauD/TfdA family dioxygenase [Alphaproteobacteria bacterium]|nr:TauD/TfdA family dioxygenase [Alphaproteobacteria bacterium]